MPEVMEITEIGNREVPVWMWWCLRKGTSSAEEKSPSQRRCPC
jgi:hypothetical protein